MAAQRAERPPQLKRNSFSMDLGLGLCWRKGGICRNLQMDFFLERVLRLWDQAGRFGVSIPGGVQGIPGCGTQGSELGTRWGLGTAWTW